MLACLELMISRLPGDTWQSGPGVLTACLPGRSDVLLLPPGSFYPVHYHDPDRDDKLRRLGQATDPWTFAVHHYWGSLARGRTATGAGVNVFSRIYQHNEWNGIETRSGPGSHREPTRRVADAIVQLVDWLGVDQRHSTSAAARTGGCPTSRAISASTWHPKPSRSRSGTTPTATTWYGTRARVPCRRRPGHLPRCDPAPEPSGRRAPARRTIEQVVPATCSPRPTSAARTSTS